MNGSMSTIGNVRQAALFGGRDSVVRGWSSPWADINVQGGVFYNALQAASYMSRAAILKLASSYVVVRFVDTACVHPKVLYTILLSLFSANWILS